MDTHSEMNKQEDMNKREEVDKSSETHRHDLYKAISFLLRYPEQDDFWEGLSEIGDFIQALDDNPAKMWLERTLVNWREIDRGHLREEYVSAFDFRESSCLYLSAHEYGDSRERGMALVELHQMYRACGFDKDGTELPDFIPVVLEFISIHPQGADMSTLEQRLAMVCHRILQHLNDESPYNSLFVALLHLLPQVDYQDENSAFPNRKDADLEELPYPMRYK